MDKRLQGEAHDARGWWGICSLPRTRPGGAGDGEGLTLPGIVWSSQQPMSEAQGQDKPLLPSP